ncbi:hypothetical protein IAI10_16600 [Clostridium sp. 19966]|uniref:hypothetical protein n=1 Tax=Clostridium sp. 19966 TaxID=2768166 RepID=UPI0028DDD828|nr:hypothetical protein [Clostridium sp. 19966]MDT8718289.1 hypothetical protein [Clostridium sp. 19966]
MNKAEEYRSLIKMRKEEFIKEYGKYKSIEITNINKDFFSYLKSIGIEPSKSVIINIDKENLLKILIVYQNAKKYGARIKGVRL